VGSLALQCARLMGFSPLCVLEASEAYRRRAVSLGADFTLNPANDHALARLLNLTEGGFPVILNCGETEDASNLTLEGLQEGGAALYLRRDDDGSPLPAAEKRSVRAFAFRDRPLSEVALRCARWMLERQSFSLENLVDREIALSALPGAWEDAKMGLVRGLMLVRPEN